MNYQEKTKRGRPQRPLPALGLIPGLRLFLSEKEKEKKIASEEYSFFLTLSPENKQSEGNPVSPPAASHKQPSVC